MFGVRHQVIGVAVSRGERQNQEDFHSYATLSLNPEELRLSIKKQHGIDWDPESVGAPFSEQAVMIGIYDGHGGSTVSQYLRQELHGLFESVNKSHIPEIYAWIKELGGYFKRYNGGPLAPWISDGPESLQEMDLAARATLTFFEVDRNLSSEPAAKVSGATASVAILHSLDAPSTPFFASKKLAITVAHVGDTRILLCATDHGRVLSMTENHRAESRIESIRLRRMMGTGLITDSFGDARWMGALQNTRSLGDLKWKPFGVTPEPEIRTRILEAPRWAFMVFVTDGVSSVVSDEEVVDLARNAPNPKRAAENILSYAEDMGSDDNMTALVVPLAGWGQVRGPDRTNDLREYRRQQMDNQCKMPRKATTKVPDLWNASDTPEEDFGSDEDREWPVDRIVGEELDVFGNIRYEASVRWKDWQRDSDGSNTTWMKEINNDHLVDTWVQRMKNQRLALAEESTAVSLLPLSFAPLHDRHTAERAEAWREKQEKAAQPNRPDPYANWDEEIQRVRQRYGPRAEPTNDVDARPVRTLPRRLGSQHSTAAPRRPRTVAANEQKTLSVTGLRARTQERWNRSIQRAGGGAAISIVNDVDAEEIPELPDDFVYRERGYSLPFDFNLPDKELFVSCDCKGSCTSADRCGCQMVSDLKEFAYDSSGMFTNLLPRGTAVIECNEQCKCSSNCRNRVAQKPRDVSLEIFKTVARGWGVCATISLPKGKVLGYYTGRMMHRKEAQEHAKHASNYMFDLDAFEHSDDEDDNVASYTVDAYHEGNWARFVKYVYRPGVLVSCFETLAHTFSHSCEPNLRVYPVCFDTIPENNAGYLAFVTLKDIPARTELNIDYDPGAADKYKKGKRSVRSLPEGTVECMCGKDSCRGYVKMAV
ncbi:hypothetical protein EWM64_g5134 [Hericium alpestre]|uniref:Uncharacterized protein n=1 Tax=Hericium alpestre TaxID=135208 RepID=A0A4Y9ZXH3_9AGAM|nr:hypothetical protein EWM64_g5134 [Hericium alpestre]